jgi:mRNA-degrading endonuclease RelE of RelBE toxin-antitoxin system
MMTRVKIEVQVEAFLKSLAPEPRRRLTVAIKGLAGNKGDRKPLEGKLEGYNRLRVAGYRVIYKERWDKRERIIDCIFAEKRAVVYELFIRLVSESIGS